MLLSLVLCTFMSNFQDQIQVLKNLLNDKGH